MSEREAPIVEIGPGAPQRKSPRVVGQQLQDTRSQPRRVADTGDRHAIFFNPDRLGQRPDRRHGRAPGAYATNDAQTYHRQVFDFGARGVDLFFVLSGFILAVPFARQHRGLDQPQPLRWYFLRRLTRLEPPLLLHLGVVGLVRLFVTGVAVTQVAGGFLGHMFYVSRVVESFRLNVVLWSLEVEAQFYLLAPLLATVYRIPARAVRTAVFVSVGVGLHLLAPHLFRNADNFCTYALYFTVGMVVADFYVTSGRFAGRQGRRWLDWVVVGLIPASLLVSNLNWRPELILPLHAGLTLLAALHGGPLARVLRQRALVTIGGMCYTIYMYHYLVIALVGRVTVEWFAGLPYEAFFVAQLVIHGLVIVTVSAILFRFTERPFMAVSVRQLFGRLRAA